MNKLSKDRRVQVVKALVEGNSIRSTVRMTGVAKNTVVKLLKELGSACLDYQDVTLVNLPCKRLECDEIWSFVYSKAKNVPAEHKGEFGYGDVWTWTAIDAETKLIPAWHVGSRDGRDAWDFIANLRDLDPPAEAEDVHAEAIESGEAAAQALQALADGIPDALSAAEAEAFFAEPDPDVEAAFGRFDDACFAIQTIADDNDIDVDLECEEEE